MKSGDGKGILCGRLGRVVASVFVCRYIVTITLGGSCEFHAICSESILQ